VTDRPPTSPSAERRAKRLARRQAALALRPSLSPTGPAEGLFRVATWNVNSLRVRLAGAERFLDRTRPDVLCFQETRCETLTSTARDAFESRGYRVAFTGSGSSNSVAIAPCGRANDVCQDSLHGPPPNGGKGRGPRERAGCSAVHRCPRSISPKHDGRARPPGMPHHHALGRSAQALLGRRPT
jgi:hypothetical protein